jgi:hypothetical protein
MLNSLGYNGLERSALNFAFDGYGDQSVECCTNGQGQTIGIARDDLSRFLTLSQYLWNVRKRRYYSSPKFGQHLRPSLGLKH